MLCRYWSTILNMLDEQARTKWNKKGLKTKVEGIENDKQFTGKVMDELNDYASKTRTLKPGMTRKASKIDRKHQKSRKKLQNL